MTLRRLLLLLGLGVMASLIVLAWLIVPTVINDPEQLPETSTGWREVSAVQTQRNMVVSAHPLATQAGREILVMGGSAIDAAVAVQAMLTLVEPQSSGIGGGAFLLHYDAERTELEAWDGRETAPAGISPELFMDAQGQPLEFMKALVGGRSVGAPGVLKMLAKVHERSGNLPWSKLFDPAIRAAREGIKIKSRLHLLLDRDLYLRAMPSARSLYYPGGQALGVGAYFSNPDLADSLELIAEQGVEVFYSGKIATDIVSAVKRATQPETWSLKLNRRLMDLGIAGGLGSLSRLDVPGFLTEQDLSEYEPQKREPICINYRVYKVCGLPPPTSGGVAVLQILGMLQKFDLSKYKPKSAEAAHLLAEAGKLAFADRNRYIGDPDFVDIDVRALLEPKYLSERADLIKMNKTLKKVKSGKLAGIEKRYTSDTSPSLPSTSHFNIVDERGNIVSMTTSVENVFGSRIVVGGFILNNQLTDFAFVPVKSGKEVANAPAPRKRPRSSMAPIFVFRAGTGEPIFTVGSAGGSRIIGFVAQAVVAVLDWGLDPQEALNLPHMLGRREPIELEREGWSPEEREKVRKELESLGHKVNIRSLNSGVHALKIAPTVTGGVDPRREGLAAGD